jgi:hypothetical protein
MPYNYACTLPVGHTTGLHCHTCQHADSQNVISTEWGGGSEPQIIYSLYFSTSAVPKWESYMKQWTPSLLYAGLFIHQRPYCYFNDHTAPAISPTHPAHACHCEISDLLVILSDVPAKRRVAALLQAKMSGGPWPPKSSNPDQWELMTWWPTFRYTPRSPKSSPGPQYRTLPFSGGPDRGGQYMILDSTAKSVETNEAVPHSSLCVWDRTVNQFLNGGAGRDFSWDRASAANDWDELIWDLIDYTWKCAAPASAGAGVGDTRGVGNFLEVKRVIDTTGGNGPPDRRATEDDSWGIPIIHFIRDGGPSEG